MQRPVIAITQARFGSTRLPGKVLKPIAGRPLLWWHLTRLQRCRLLDGIVVATTEEPEAAEIAAIAQGLGVPVWRGPLDDVLARYQGAAEMSGAATVVRVTSDCPLIDPMLVDRLIAAFAEAGPGLDYLSLDVSRLPRGLDAEIFPVTALATAAREAVAPEEREHVTAFLYRRRERFRIASLAPEGIEGRGLRLCVDTAEDFDLVTRIIAALAPKFPAFGWDDIARLLAANPDWAEINAAVAQKPV